MLLLMATGCSHDENNNEPNGAQKQTVQFSFTNEDFGADEVPTRSAAEAKPQTLDLGDCEAEISVESEPAVKTRAPKPATGHYTIRAYQGGTLKGEMSGTFSAGKFIADAASPQDLILDPGTYDFIAFGDGFTASGNELIATVDKADKALIGTTTATITPTPHKQTVNFTMKHVGCRLRTQFICQKHIPEDITATLEETAANTIPTSMTYNLLTQATSYTNGTMTPQPNNSPKSKEALYTASAYGKNYSYTSTSDYHYFFPTTEGSKLKLTGISAGTVFWKPINFAISQLNATLQMQKGKSYCVKIKLTPKFRYLFSDGTAGTLSANPGKTPIGVVVKEKGGDPAYGIAMALKEANNGNLAPWGGPDETWINVPKYKWGSSYKHVSGYEITWDAAATYNNDIKATIPGYSGFYHAAHYNPGVGVTGSNVGKWFLPCGMESYYTIVNLYFNNVSAPPSAYYNVPGYGCFLEKALTDVGGSYYPTGRTYMLASEEKTTEFQTYAIGRERFYHSAGIKSLHPAYIRAFVRF